MVRALNESIIESIMSKVINLPTLPEVVKQVRQLVHDPNSSADDLAAIMKQDQVLSFRVLTLVNSAYYLVPQKVIDVRRAISIVGYNTVFQLVLSVSVFNALPQNSGKNFNVKALWKHSLGCAVAAETIARRRRYPVSVCQEIFTAGLMHDLGKVAIASFFPDVMEMIVTNAIDKNISFHQSEKELDLPGHDFVGQRMAERWYLPETILAAIGWHHRLTPEAKLTLNKELHHIPDIIALGDILTRQKQYGQGGDNYIPEIEPNLLLQLKLSAEDLDFIQNDFVQGLNKSVSFLDALA